MECAPVSLNLLIVASPETSCGYPVLEPKAMSPMVPYGTISPTQRQTPRFGEKNLQNSPYLKSVPFRMGYAISSRQNEDEEQQ